MQVDDNVGHQYLRPFKLRRRACSQTIFFQRPRSSLPQFVCRDEAGLSFRCPDRRYFAVRYGNQMFPHSSDIVFVPGCCKPRQRDAGPAKAVRAKGKTQCSCVPFL